MSLATALLCIKPMFREIVQPSAQTVILKLKTMYGCDFNLVAVTWSFQSIDGLECLPIAFVHSLAEASSDLCLLLQIAELDLCF